MPEKTIDSYIRSLGDWRGDVVAELCEIVGEAEPSLEKKIMWGQPVFRNPKGPVCFIKAFPRAVHCGFWWGKKLTDPKGWLEGEGGKMAHLKIREGEKIPKSDIQKFVREAAPLNEKLGDPTKTKA
jgi:hypothetical protein